MLWNSMGTVTGTEASESSKGGITYRLKYQYEVDKERKSGSASVKQAVYQLFQGKDKPKPPVTVHYLALGPFERAELHESGSLWTEIAMIALWTAFWNTVVLAAWYDMWVVPLRIRALYKNGEASSGTLVGKRVRTGRSSSYYVTYTFRDSESGELRQVESEVWNVSAWNAAVAGNAVRVLYAQDNPKRSTVYELGGYRVEGG